MNALNVIKTIEARFQGSGNVNATIDTARRWEAFFRSFGLPINGTYAIEANVAQGEAEKIKVEDLLAQGVPQDVPLNLYWDFTGITASNVQLSLLSSPTQDPYTVFLFVVASNNPSGSPDAARLAVLNAPQVLDAINKVFAQAKLQFGL